MIKRTIRHCNS